MRIIISTTLSLILCGTASSYAADNTAEPGPSKTTAMERVGTFATKLFTTVKNLSDDIVPLVKAADEELARQWRADWPAIQEDIRQQFRVAVPGNKPKADSER
jgi:hypothetical protein